jgi:hypothetical protein
MIVLLIIIALLTWYLLGLWSFVHWWTSQNDLTTDDISLAIIVGFLGPIAYLSGWIIHGRNKVKTILITKRK